MRTVAETAIFQRYAADIWSEDERNEFIAWMATNRMQAMSYLVAVAVAKFVGLVLDGANAAVRVSSTSTRPTRLFGY